MTTNTTWAQQDSSYANFGGVIFLDSMVVTATRSGFDTEDFITMVQKDSSFIKAFQNIRLMEYDSDNDIRFFDKKGKQIAQLRNTIHQNIAGNCRTMDIIKQEVTGNYYKRKNKRRYYTAKMYEEIFFTYERTCHQGKGSSEPKDAIEGRIQDLKVLIFQPGSSVGVPVVGKKTRIFDPELLSYYDYALESKKYKSEIDCYVFSTKWKENLTKNARSNTIIEKLETYFDKSTFAVVARNYKLHYKSVFIDFDATINIELIKVGNQYVPEFLHFDGFWNVPFKKEERVWFETKFYY